MAAATIAIVMITMSAVTAASAYTNHTVGGSAGWFFNLTTNTSSSNYSNWASSQTFNLGDFLIFNTNTNLTVIQTYNDTTYKSCNSDDASDADTFIYNGGGGGNNFGEALTLAVPLTREGPNYYFSDADDGVQCEQGMAFEILVKHGQGLPPSLNQPPPPPYIEPPMPSDSAQAPPTVPNNQQETFYNGGFRRGDVDILVGVLALILGRFMILQ